MAKHTVTQLWLYGVERLTKKTPLETIREQREGIVVTLESGAGGQNYSFLKAKKKRKFLNLWFNIYTGMR